MQEEKPSRDASAHTPGVHKGEEENAKRGRSPRGNRSPRASRDATSINPRKRAPIDPRMPILPPA